MPKTRGESIFFTAITAWMMVYVITLYSTVLATGTFTNLTFFIAPKNMWIEYIIIGLPAYFVSGHLAKMCVFRVVQPINYTIHFPRFIIHIFLSFRKHPETNYPITTASESPVSLPDSPLSYLQFLPGFFPFVTYLL